MSNVLTTPDTHTPETGLPEAEIRGRSLGQMAFARLRRNKAAMVSIIIMLLMATFCFLGPHINPHGYSDIYPSYVAVPPSLSPYPHADTLIPVMTGAVERGKARLDSLEVTGTDYVATISADTPLDPRIIRYLDRPDEFDGATIAETANDGKTMVINGKVNGQYFYLGTDRNGRDMLARIMVGGQISLMVGILATLVSLVIGVTYGAISGYMGGRTDNIMMRLVEILYSLPFIFSSSCWSCSSGGISP